MWGENGAGDVSLILRAPPISPPRPAPPTPCPHRSISANGIFFEGLEMFKFLICVSEQQYFPPFCC